MTRIGTDSGFDPLDQRFLRSREAREVPTALGNYLTGAVYPNEEDLGDLISLSADAETATRLPNACVIVSSPDYQARRVLYGRTLSLGARRRDAHVCAWGPTGVGKTTRVTLPMLLSDLEDPNRSIVSASLKGEEYALLAAYCAQQKVPLRFIDLTDPECSLAFNPLEVTDASRAYDVITAFVDLVVNRHSRDSEFWRQNGTTFLSGAWHAGCKSFPAMLDLFESSRQETLRRLESSSHPSARASAAFLKSGSQNADTTVATVIGWLNPFRDPVLRATTNTNELQVEELFKSRQVLVIRCPEPRLTSVRAVYNLLLQCLLDAAISVADRGPHPSASFYIEDLPAWGPIPSLVDRLATLRSRRISVNVAMQSMAQLRFAYGADAEAVEKAFVNKIILPGVDQQDAEYFARCSGEQQVLVSHGSAGGASSTLLTRYVLAPADIRAPRWKHFLLGQPATLVLQDMAFQAYLCPQYLRQDLRLLMHEAALCGSRPAPRAQPLTCPEPTVEPDTILVATARLTNTQGMSQERIRELIEAARKSCGWPETNANAKKWWESFEEENKERLSLILRLLEELVHRKATISEFFLAVVYSNTDNIMANLHYLDYCRAKKEHEQKKKRSLNAGK